MEVRLLVNGKEVRLKDFPQRVLYNLIEGYVKSLNLQEEPRHVEVHVRLKEDHSRDTNL